MADTKKRQQFLADLNPPLRARQGRKLIVVGVARISGKNQNELSLTDQEALYRSWLKQRTRRPFTLIMIATRGSGERVDRRELRRLKKLIRGQRVDLVLAEDIGRIMRRIHAFLLCEMCEDHDVRLIAIND